MCAHDHRFGTCNRLCPDDLVIPDCPTDDFDLRVFVASPDLAAPNVRHLSGRTEAALTVDWLGPCETALILADNDGRTAVIIADPPDRLVTSPDLLAGWALGGHLPLAMLLSRTDVPLDVAIGEQVLRPWCDAFHHRTEVFATAGVELVDWMLQSRDGEVFCSLALRVGDD